MQIGFILPQTELGPDPTVVRDLAQAAEGLGYRHLLAGEHVLGHVPEAYPDLRSAYPAGTTWHEPMTLFAYLAGQTQRLEFITGILILPMRQTALVAKQATEVDLMSGGRLILGVGVGVSPVEYESMGAGFRTRGRRIEEQVALLRALWADHAVTFEGKYERVMHAGISPLPARQIPIWIGGTADVVLDRAARIAEGWIVSYFGSREELAQRLAHLRAAAEAAGRDPTALAIHVGVSVNPDNIGRHLERLPWWEQAGVSHLSVRTADMGLTSPAAHLEVLRTFAEAAGLKP